jgi:hypothetical protein
MSIFFSELIENCIKIFIDEFTVYGNSFNQCLSHRTILQEL